ncbi:MAG: hypothetical protein J6M31_06830 [Bacteroidales bacterium]|nr:hypothetical protein [Bacteroidales bacterium]
MTKKELYCSPQTDILELRYAEPVCQAVSGNVPDFTVDDYDPVWDVL